jgi:hypothetical protein
MNDRGEGTSFMIILESVPFIDVSCPEINVLSKNPIIRDDPKASAGG